MCFANTPFAKETYCIFEAYSLNRTKMHSDILFVIFQIHLKNLLLSISKSSVSCACAYRAGHTLSPVKTQLSVSNLKLYY